MLKNRILHTVVYRKMLAILLVGFAVFCVVFVWSASAQDDTPLIHPRPITGVVVTTPPPTLADTPQTPVLTIASIPSQKIGHSVTTTATLVNAQDVPQANKPLLIFVDGRAIRRDRTDQNGVSSISLGPNLSLGDHQLQVQFLGTAAYFGVTASSTFTIVPLQLTLETVPPLAGIPISVNSQVITTNSKGLVVIDVGIPGPINLEVLQKPEGAVDENTRASFVRWSDEGFQPSRTVDITNDDRLQIGLSVSHPISHTFVDLSGNPVDFSKVSGMQVRTSTGGLVSFNDNKPHWITATEIARRRNGLEATNILYSVESVTIDGTNVVNRYQQHFFAAANTPWQIQLLLYSVTVNANDALFGFPVGTGISLQYPDGHVQTLTFGASKTISLETLARGTYQIKVNGIGSLTGATPVALSRDQAVQLQVFSYLDVAVILVIGVLVALTLLFYGRPFLMKLPLMIYRRLHRRPKVPDGILAGEKGSFNLTFFHSSAIDNVISPLSPTNVVTANPRRAGNVLQISGSEGLYTKPILINFPLGNLVCIVNGKSKRGQLLIDLLHQWQAELMRRSAPANTTLQPKSSRLQQEDGVFGDICKVYASLPESRHSHYRPEQFDFNTNGAQCKNCDGKGRFPDTADGDGYIICPVCRGKGYKPSILKIKLDSESISDVLNMTVSEAVGFFGDYPTVANKLLALERLGFGDILIGAPGMVLSANGILNLQDIRDYIGHNLYLFNVPLGKVQPASVARQVNTLAQLLERRSTVRIIADNTAPRLIENPVVMVKLGADHARANADDATPVQGGAPALGMNS